MITAVASVTAASPQTAVRHPTASTTAESGKDEAMLPSDPMPTVTPASVANTAAE